MWKRVLVWAAVVPAALWALIRLVGWDTWYPMTQLIAFTPYVAVLSVLPLLVVVLLRQWPAAAVAAVASIALALCVVPRAVADGDAGAGASGPELRVMTANVLAGDADPGELADLVRENRVDVLLVQELTPDFDTTLLEQHLPHKVVYPRPGVIGSGIYSRLPLRDDGVRINPGGFGQAMAELTGLGVLIESAHPQAPWGRPVMADWRGSLAGQPRATLDGPPRILGGDFNATLDHSLLQNLISSGYRDAAGAVGKGWTGTWGPYDGDTIPPVALDRVLADRRIGVLDFEVFDLPGSDHRPVMAVLRLPVTSSK